MDPAAQAVVEEVYEQGWAVVEGAVDQATVACMNEVIDGLFAASEVRAGGRFQGPSTFRIPNLVGKHPVFAEAAQHPMLLEVAEGLLGEGFLLSSMSSIVVGPGESSQLLHSDDQAISLPRSARQVPMCTTMWALDDFTERNGATRLVPGSHRLPDVRGWRGTPAGPEPASVPAVMPAGSILVYHGGLYHGAGANTSDAPRRALAVGYCAGYIRPVENHLLAMGRDELLALPPRLQELCGLRMFQGIHGHLEGRDPVDVLAGR